MANTLKPTRTLFGRRLREARLRAGIAQDKLGVMIGLDEGCSSARMSRYESGTHEPPLLISQLLAKALRLPMAYFYAEDDTLAALLSLYGMLDVSERETLLNAAETLAGARGAERENNGGVRATKRMG